MRVSSPVSIAGKTLVEKVCDRDPDVVRNPELVSRYARRVEKVSLYDDGKVLCKMSDGSMWDVGEVERHFREMRSGETGVRPIPRIDWEN